MQTGDFILIDGNHFVSGLIRFGQRIRFRGKDRPYARFNHAALVVSDSGDIVEALTKGVVKADIGKYDPSQYVLVETHTSPEDQKQILRFADRCVGMEYGWLTIASIFFGVLTGGKLSVGYQGQSICSGLVARAQERSGAIFDRLPEDIMPADLARYYEVK